MHKSNVKLIALVLGFSAFACCPALFGQAKKLAPGVLKVVPAVPDVRDSYSLPTALPGLDVNSYKGQFVSDRDTLYGQTQNVVFFRDVWQV